MNGLLFRTFFLIGLCFACPIHSQPLLERVDTVEVYIANNKLKLPWTGGLNFCQFSSIDLNLDGIKDLFVFDRTGNRITTYLNGGASGQVDYIHAPEYQAQFPDLNEWALLADYNCDGKEDIFTYSTGGFAVYKNISNLATGLQFTKVTSLVKSQQFYNYLNLYVSSVDIPAIVDVDNDGDLDVLTFQITGSRVEYHKNLSMETYGVCDSLNKYVLKNTCWGYFSENAFSNSMTLFDTCSSNVSNPEIRRQSENNSQYKGSLHSGSSLLAYDKDGDGDKELLLGDVSFNNLTELTNGGSTTGASVVAQDGNFPSNSVKVDLAVFPAAYYLDVNNDGKKDLLVSPNVPNMSENFNSIWYYENTGTTSVPIFTHTQNNFLQAQMIETGEGAYPVFFDYNSDGKLDLIIGNHGYFQPSGGYTSGLSVYENTGTVNNPQFTLITRDYANLSSLALNSITPSFGDLDADGDEDMIIGDFTGLIHYYENTAGVGNPASFTLSQVNYMGIDIGQLSAPQLIDVNRDNKLDLLIGEQGGNLNYFENMGTATIPVFSSAPTNATFGGVKVNRAGYITGYSTPFLFEEAGVYKLLVGSERGYLFMYDSIDGNLTGNFNLVDSIYQGITEGTRIAPFGADINNDAYIDLIIGNYSGGVALYYGQTPNAIAENFKNEEISFDVYPNPSHDVFYINSLNKESLMSLEVYNNLGQLVKQLTINDQKEVRLNLTGMNKGLYYIGLTTTKGNKGHKRIILY